MADFRPPEAGVGQTASRHGHRTAVIAGVVLVCAAIVVPFGLHGLHDSDAHAAPGPLTSSGAQVTPADHHATSGELGSRADLPALLPARRPALRDGEPVRVGDVTTGVLRRTTGGWQVEVRWDGRTQPLVTTGRVSLRDGTSWVARSGLLYTRVPTATAGRFKVYAWQPEGGSVYTAPTLAAAPLGQVCFDDSFTDFGGCVKG